MWMNNVVNEKNVKAAVAIPVAGAGKGLHKGASALRWMADKMDAAGSACDRKAESLRMDREKIQSMLDDLDIKIEDVETQIQECDKLQEKGRAMNLPGVVRQAGEAREQLQSVYSEYQQGKEELVALLNS